MTANNITLVCLGVGKGLSFVTEGMPSSSFALVINHHPRILIDCGTGVGFSCITKFNGINPTAIYISHNHVDHSGDLAAIIQFNYSLGHRTRVFGHSKVLNIVREHRLHELINNNLIDQAIDWIYPDEFGSIIIDELTFKLFQTKHSYICYGFVLELENKKILGFSADSGFDEKLYQVITQAPLVIVHGREQSSNEHASFDEIDNFARDVAGMIKVSHYEQSLHKFKSKNVSFLEIDETLKITTH